MIKNSWNLINKDRLWRLAREFNVEDKLREIMEKLV